MLKGLLTRQIFMFVDLALAVLTVFVAYQVFTKLFQAPPGLSAPSGNTVEEVTPTLPTVGPRDNYNAIVASRLFGPAGDVAKGPDTPVGPLPPGPIVETAFANLKLKGTSFTKVRPNALIEQQSLGTRVYQPGEEVIPGEARLEEVHNRWVYLFNIKKNQREVLRMDDELELDLAAIPEVPSAIAPPSAPDPGRNNITLKRDELQQELQAMTENITDLVTTANPHPVMGPDGKPIGFTADNIGEIPLAKRLKFKDGDVVKEINGMPILSLENVTEAIEKFQGSNNFHVTVLRNGTPTLIRFKLE